MRIAVVGCCQAHGYAHALAHLLPEAEVDSVEAVVSRNHDRLEEAAALLRDCDMLSPRISAPSSARWRPPRCRRSGHRCTACRCSPSPATTRTWST